MEGAIYQNEEIFFNSKAAMLPIKCKDDSELLFNWGRKSEEFSILPIGSYLHYLDLKRGKYDRFFPKNVKILVQAHLQINFDSHNLEWFELLTNQYIHGVILNDGHLLRLYPICVPCELDQRYKFWPRILSQEMIKRPNSK